MPWLKFGTMGLLPGLWPWLMEWFTTEEKEIAEFEELMRKTIADIVSEASSVACWVYVQKYVKHKTLNEMLQELPDVGQFILAMNIWFEKLMEK